MASAARRLRITDIDLRYFTFIRFKEPNWYTSMKLNYAMQRFSQNAVAQLVNKLRVFMKLEC
jgi:hypothetical protein